MVQLHQTKAPEFRFYYQCKKNKWKHPKKAGGYRLTFFFFSNGPHRKELLYFWGICFTSQMLTKRSLLLTFVSKLFQMSSKPSEAPCPPTKKNPVIVDPFFWKQCAWSVSEAVGLTLSLNIMRILVLLLARRMEGKPYSEPQTNKRKLLSSMTL